MHPHLRHILQELLALTQQMQQAGAWHHSMPIASALRIRQTLSSGRAAGLLDLKAAVAIYQRALQQGSTWDDYADQLDRNAADLIRFLKSPNGLISEIRRA